MALEQATSDPESNQSPQWLTDDFIAQLKAEYGDIYLIQIPDLPNAALVIKHPDRLSKAYREFVTRARKGRKQENAALETFTHDHIVYPTGKELEDILKHYPALWLVVGGELVSLTRQKQEHEP